MMIQMCVVSSDLAMILETPCRSTLRHLTFNWYGSVTEVGIGKVLQDCSQLEVLNAFVPRTNYLPANTEQMERWCTEYPDIQFCFYMRRIIIIE